MESFAPIVGVINNHPYASSASVVLACATLVHSARWYPRTRLPPGPKGYPIVGNLFDLPPTHVWEKLGAWGKQYGDIIYINSLGQGMITLNSSKAAVELLDKKSANYSDRPIVMMSGEIVGWNRTLALTRYGPRFRELRKYMNRLIGTRASTEKFVPLQEKEMAKFVARVMADPSSLFQQIRRTAGAVILMMSHGYSVEEHNDPVVEVFEVAGSSFSQCLEPGAFLVDAIPLLRYIPEWFPGTGWKTKAKQFAKLLDDMVDIPHQFVKDQMASGTAVPSFTSELLSGNVITPEVEDNIKWSAASLSSGGADTTVATLHTFYLAMVLYPEAQHKAQAEIDRTIGGDRFPMLADQPNLPYIDALMKEVLRWKPVVPLGVTHVAVEDDIYKGYFIPKGTSIVANIWQILHDPVSYTNPLEFNPERFLGDHPEPDPREVVFGYGRRICPGLHLAQSSLWIAFATALAVFGIQKCVDEFGNVVEPEVRFSSGLVSRPDPFKCTIKPRSEKSATLVASVEI